MIERLNLRNADIENVHGGRFTMRALVLLATEPLIEITDSRGATSWMPVGAVMRNFSVVPGPLGDWVSKPED